MQLRKSAVVIAIMMFTVFLGVSLNGFAESIFLQAVPDEVDFGTVEEGNPVAVTATVKNTGTTPVEITNVRTN